MEDTPCDELRRLALWLSRRREVDEAVAILTVHGPAACDRVHSHLDALARLLRLEQEAFADVEAAAPPVPQSPLPGTLEEHADRFGTVHALSRPRLSSSSAPARDR